MAACLEGRGYTVKSDWLRRDGLTTRDKSQPMNMTTAATHHLLPLRASAPAPQPIAPREVRGVSSLRWRQHVCAFSRSARHVLLAGCTTVGPDFVKPEAPVLAQWQEADGAVVTQAPAEQIRWWEAFRDPVLSQLIDIAYSKQLQPEDRRPAGSGGAGPVRDRRGLLSTPRYQQANGSANYTAASKNAANTKAGDLEYWEYNVGASVSWELDFWGKFRRAIESADANLLASDRRL